MIENSETKDSGGSANTLQMLEISDKASSANMTISYSKAFLDYLLESWPLLSTRGIELGTDFIGMAMLANINNDVLSATSIISSSQIVLRSVNATFLFYTGVKTAIAAVSGQKHEIGSILKAGWFFAVGLSIPAAGLAFFSAPLLKLFQQPDSAANISQEYLRAFSYGLPITLMSITNQQIAYGLQEAKLVFLITAVTRPLALALGYSLIYGLGGLPKLGVAGLGYANSLSYAVNFTLFIAVFALAKRFADCHIMKFSKQKIISSLGEIIKKGIPIGAYASIELGSLLYSTILTGRISATKLAALQPAIQYGSFLANTTFALGTSTGIIVGRHITQKKYNDAIRFGNISNLLSLLIPLVVLIIFLSMSQAFISPFIKANHNNELIATAYILLLINLVGQLFDGLRNSSTGILRGHKDTFTPMAINLLAMLLINIPLASVSSYVFDNVEGILSARTFAIAVSAFVIFAKQIFISYTAEKEANAPLSANKKSVPSWPFFKYRESEQEPLLMRNQQNDNIKPATTWRRCIIL